VNEKTIVRAGPQGHQKQYINFTYHQHVCVCVCEGEREIERERETDRQTERKCVFENGLRGETCGGTFLVYLIHLTRYM
jgi:hypothetical protein